MAFKMSVQKYSGKISEVEIGKGEKAIKIGGESTLPFYSFDGNTGNTQKVGVEINDIRMISADEEYIEDTFIQNLTFDINTNGKQNTQR